jgi:hypothetical protein
MLNEDPLYLSVLSSVSSPSLTVSKFFIIQRRPILEIPLRGPALGSIPSDMPPYHPGIPGLVKPCYEVWSYPSSGFAVLFTIFGTCVFR